MSMEQRLASNDIRLRHAALLYREWFKLEGMVELLEGEIGERIESQLHVVREVLDGEHVDQEYEYAVVEREHGFKPSMECRHCDD